jgi:sulfate permease, SulP family
MKFPKFTKGDFFGGLTAGIVALPLALAFGVHSGLGAEAGLYGAIFLGFFAAAFGGTPSQVSGPTGPMTVVSSATIAGFIAVTSDLQHAMGAIIACFVLAGILQVITGVLKLGDLIRYIPYPVISGFMSGIGIIIILLQLYPALGSESPGSTPEVIGFLGKAIRNVNYWSLLYAALSIAIIYLFPKLTKAVPSTLVALLSVTVLSLIVKTDVPVIGDIPTGFPVLQAENLLSVDSRLYIRILTAALTLAGLGCIDSLLTSVVADNFTKTKHNSNRELVGQGIGNTVSGLFGGIPGAGATMRTMVNIRSGGRNRSSGILHSITLLIILLGAGKYAAFIPNAVLAGILITVGIGILDYKGFRHLVKIPRSDAAITIIVMVITVFLDLLTAVGVGVVLAALIFMKKMSDVASEKTKVRDLASYDAEIDWPDKQTSEYMKENILIKHVDGPLFFGFATEFQLMSSRLPDIKFVIISMEKVPFIDQTGLYALEEAIRALEQRGVNVLFAGLQQQPEAVLRIIKLVPDMISEEHLFADVKDSINWLASNKILFE